MKLNPVYFLLVDDLEENLLSLEALLRREDLVLLKARSGTEALELLLQHEVALALLDVQMPGMDGFELAELMRGTKRTRRVPIIFLTAGSDDKKRRFRGYETGAVDFLHKPIETDILKSKASVFFDLFRQQQQLIQQHAELSKYAIALKDADRRKDEFLAMLAHELRNPLAPIRNGLQILNMSPDPKILSEVRDIMDRQLTHMVRLIDDLLDVSRVSQGKIDLRKETINLNTIIQTAIESSRPLIDNAGHTLTVNITNEPLWLDADHTRLAQVIGNLLNNAAKYTPQNGQINLSAYRSNDDVVIEVKDNGLGIPENMLPSVFDLFTQIDRNLERSQGGLGIGLALVKKLVAMHNGSIKVESEGSGKGSTFTVKLPFSKNHIQEVKIQESPENQQPNSGLNVLVVDDNIPSAKTTGWTLEFIGHKPTLAHDGLEALEMAKNLKPDVILLDIGLPGMNGYDICRELRKLPEFKDTIMIAQTGWGQERDRQTALEAGFNHHLTKPVDFNDLSKLLAPIKPK